MTTKQINAGLQIVKLGEIKFKAPGGYYKPTGYALRHPELGYFAFSGEDTPYTPKGGRKALKQILAAGGMLNFDTCTWLQELK